MFNIFLLSFQVRLTISANHLIHFLRCIPIVKKGISESFYGIYDLKKVFFMLGAFLIALKKVFFKFFYVGSISLIGVITCLASLNGGFQEFFNTLESENPFNGINATEVIFYILSVWFIFSFAGSAFNSKVIDISRYEQHDTMINYMRTNPAVYAKSYIFSGCIIEIILYLPYLILAFIISEIPLFGFFTLLALFVGCRLFGEILNMLLFRYAKTHFGKPPLSFLGIFVFAAAVLLPVYYGVPDWSKTLSSPLVFAEGVIIALLSFLYIKNYQGYAHILRERINYILKFAETAKKKEKARKTVVLRDADKWSKNVEKSDLAFDKHNKKSGFAYLNAIFFDRHRRFFINKLLQRIVTVLSIGAALCVISLIKLRQTGTPLTEIFQNSEQIKSIYDFAPILLFVIYIASMGRVVTASVFSNCDIHMLHYTYYRTQETIYASFKSRFAFILRYNLILTSVIGITAVTAIGFASAEIDYFYSLVLYVLIICMGVFFAFNDIFLYYAIQPYDSAGQTKSIAYTIINTVIYIFSYMNLQLRFSFIHYAVFMFILTSLYIGIGIILLLRFAPANFKLR